MKTFSIKNPAETTLVILLKGTIDSEKVAETPQNVKSLPVSLVPTYLEDILKTENKYCFAEVSRAKDDSKFYTEKDMEHVLNLVKKSYDDGVRNFVITFGTDAMVRFTKQAKSFLENGMDDAGLVFTGAMEPLINIFDGGKSDAEKNLKFIDKEIGAVGLKQGAHIVMHGKYIEPENAVKLPKSKKIVTIDDPKELRRLRKEHEASFGEKSYTLY